MNIEELKDEVFINFASKVVGYNVSLLRPDMARSVGIVGLHYIIPDNGLVATGYEVFTFTKDTCVKRNDFGEVKNLSADWVSYAEALKQDETVVL